MDSEFEPHLEQTLVLNERLRDMDRKVQAFLQIIIDNIPNEERMESLDRKENRPGNSLLSEWHNVIINYRLVSRFLGKQILNEKETNEILDNIHFLTNIDRGDVAEDLEMKRGLVNNLSKYLHNLLEQFKKEYGYAIMDS